MKFLRWLTTPSATPLAVAAAWLIGNQQGYLSGIGAPWWAGWIVTAAVLGAWVLAEWALPRLLRRKSNGARADLR